MAQRSAFIIGGTGQIGRAAATRLLRGGWQVRLAHRGERADGVDGVESVRLDRDDTDALLAAARGSDLVLDTIAYGPEQADQLVALAPDVGSLVVISTGSVYAGVNGDDRYLETSELPEDYPLYPDPLTEDLPIVPGADGAYTPRKAEVERRLLASGHPVSILRPGAIHGRGGNMLREWWFIKRVLDGRMQVPVAYDGASVFSTSATANIAELVALCAGAPARRVLNAVDDEQYSVAQIGEAVFRLLGHDGELVPFSGPPAPEDVGGTPWSVPHPIRMSMAAARADLGYRPVVGYEESLEDDIRWALDEVAAAERRGGDWRDAFPLLVSRYGGGAWFPYAAEDEFLMARGAATRA